MTDVCPTVVRLLPMVLLATVCGCGSPSDPASQRRELTIKGSDTMVHLASTWAEEFMKEHSDVDVSVTGGGSGTGIAALLNGTTDLCAASRDIKEKERTLAAKKGIEPTEFVVARDGLAVIVHPGNPVGELTIEQIAKIFTGKTKNWKEVGGPDEPILILSRESSSGTYVFFQEHVLQKADYAVAARLMPATAAIVESVSQDRSAIGYVGLGYLNPKVKALKIKKDEQSPAVEPSEATVAAGKYTIARPLYLYSNGPPTGAAKRFLEFCLGADGQRIVRETGYVAVQ